MIVWGFYIIYNFDLQELKNILWLIFSVLYVNGFLILDFRMSCNIYFEIMIKWLSLSSYFASISLYFILYQREIPKKWIAISKAKNYFEVIILIYIRWTKAIQNIFDWKRVLLWAILFESTNPNSTTTTRPWHQKVRLNCQISPSRDGISWPILSSMLEFRLAWLPAGPVHVVTVAVTSYVQVFSYVWKTGFHWSHSLHLALTTFLPLFLNDPRVLEGGV